MAGTLSITFRGPFVFSLENDHVDVYAPKCDAHLAGIFWTANEHPITGLAQCGGQHTYAIRGGGITSNNSSTPIKFLPVPPGGNGGILPGVQGTKPQTQYAYFHFSVPRPKIIYGMNADTVEVVKANTGPCGSADDYATGVRFYYDWTVGSDVLMSIPFYQPIGSHNPPPTPINITPPTGGGLPDYGDIELQYDGPQSGDPDHNDAISCFNQIALLAGVNWWLSYYDSQNTGNQVRTGSDCRATPMILGA